MSISDTGTQACFYSPVSTPTRGGHKRALVQPFRYTYAPYGPTSGVLVTVMVPVGFEFTPSIPRPVLPFVPKYSLEAVSCVHDYLYYRKGDLGHIKLTQHEADRVLLSNQSDPQTFKTLAYYYCRAFGFLAWRDRIQL